ncbi:MAG: phosphotransferase family protein [Bryobacteraceae bacterium]|nr:phosphotransferase family protein [Bryobacteraceae bacterium]
MSSSAPDTAAVRAGEELNLAGLSVWLGTQDITVTQFPGGHSNLTYLVTTPDAEYVLRRPPLGPVAPKAHDMAREYRLLAALHPVFRAAPQPISLCEDLSILGAPFFLMERRRGVIYRTAAPAELAAPLSRAFLSTLVQLHSLDLEETGLLALGKPDGFLSRQVAGWIDRWRRAADRPLPAAEYTVNFLVSFIPESGPPALIHNDYKLDNIMFSDDPNPTVVAVLDWEMATVGDPLLDLGVALAYWRHAQLPDPPFTTGPGWWTRDQIVEHYAARTARDVSRLAYYEVFGVFKLIVIVQQIYARWLRGQTRDERFAGFGAVVEQLARTAARLAEQVA